MCLCTLSDCASHPYWPQQRIRCLCISHIIVSHYCASIRICIRFNCCHPNCSSLCSSTSAVDKLRSTRIVRFIQRTVFIFVAVSNISIALHSARLQGLQYHLVSLIISFHLISSSSILHSIVQRVSRHPTAQSHSIFSKANIITIIELLSANAPCHITTRLRALSRLGSLHRIAAINALIIHRCTAYSSSYSYL